MGVSICVSAPTKSETRPVRDFSQGRETILGREQELYGVGFWLYNNCVYLGLFVFSFAGICTKYEQNIDRALRGS